MTTITAKQLRDNLEEILDRVQAGEEIALTYRHKLMAKLVPEKSAKRRGASGLDAMLAAPRKEHNFNNNRSIKELYHELLEEEYVEKK